MFDGNSADEYFAEFEFVEHFVSDGNSDEHFAEFDGNFVDFEHSVDFDWNCVGFVVHKSGP